MSHYLICTFSSYYS